MRTKVSMLITALLAVFTVSAQMPDMIVCERGSYTVPSISEASNGRVDGYRWFENGILVSSSTLVTNTNLTIPAGKAVGTYQYVRQAHAADCDLWQSSNVFTVKVVDVGHNPGTTATMQEFCPTNYTTNSTWVLTDARADAGGQTYTVRYLADGRFWMVNDLKYPTACGTRTSGFSGATSQGTLGAKVPGFYGDCTNAKNGSTPANRGYLYDWMFTMQNAGAYYGCSWDPGCTDNPGSNAACQGICPEGWHLPTGNSTTGEFTLLNKAVNGGSTNSPAGLLNTSTFSAVYGGYANSGSLSVQGSTGYYWSSSFYTTNYAHYIGFNSTHVTQSNGNNSKYLGLLVRCIRNY